MDEKKKQIKLNWNKIIFEVFPTLSYFDLATSSKMEVKTMNRPRPRYVYPYIFNVSLNEMPSIHFKRPCSAVLKFVENSTCIMIFVIYTKNVLSGPI